MKNELVRYDNKCTFDLFQQLGMVEHCSRMKLDDFIRMTEEVVGQLNDLLIRNRTDMGFLRRNTCFFWFTPEFEKGTQFWLNQGLSAFQIERGMHLLEEGDDRNRYVDFCYRSIAREYRDTPYPARSIGAIADEFDAQVPTMESYIAHEQYFLDRLKKLELDHPVHNVNLDFFETNKDDPAQRAIDNLTKYIGKLEKLVKN